MSDLHKLTGAYAVDALDDLERARFEQHLSSCEDCRGEVLELRETAALLAETASVAPPASLRVSVLAGISQVRPLAPEVPARTEVAGRRWFPLLVAAAMVVIAGVGAVVWQPWSSSDGSLTAAEQVLQADDAQRVSVDLGEGGVVTVVRSKKHDKAVLVTKDMLNAPEGKAFEVWLMPGKDQYVKAGLVPDGADQTVVLDGSAADAVAVGITVEPDAGSNQPTTTPIALLDLDEEE